MNKEQTYRAIRICMYCDEFLGWKEDCTTPISHGICKPCLAKQRAEIEKVRKCVTQ